MALTKVTYDSVFREVSQTFQNPAALGQKIAKFSERMLTELDYQEIVTLERTAMVHTGTHTTIVASVTHATIINMIAMVKKSKPQFDKLVEASQSMVANQLDEACALLDQINDENFEPQKQQLFNAIIEKYRQKGENNQADTLAQKLKRKTFETPAERGTLEVGKNMVNQGIGLLKAISPPDRSFPTKDQMGDALENLHKASLISNCRERDSSLESESVELLQTKLVAAEQALEVQRKKFEQACSTGNHGIIMPALTKKQEAMQEVLRLKSALHHNGVSQAEEGDSNEVINAALRKGVVELKKSFVPEGSDGEEGECKQQ